MLNITHLYRQHSFVETEFDETYGGTFEVTENERAACIHVPCTAHIRMPPVSILFSSAWIAQPGNIITIKDTGRGAADVNIVLQTEGAEQIETENELILDSNGIAVTLQSNGTDLYVISMFSGAIETIEDPMF